MWQFIGWTCLTLVLLGLSWTSGYRAKDVWDMWYKQKHIPIQQDQSDPQVKVKINKKSAELLINITTAKHVSTLAIDVPILGKVNSIHDYNSIADAQTPLKQITGSQTPISQNNVEFLIENIKPNSNISYKVIFEPMKEDIFVAGTDRYKIAYTWNFEGNVLSKEKWIAFESGEEVEKPNIQVKGFFKVNRALTPEEVKRLYEQGPPKRKVD